MSYREELEIWFLSIFPEMAEFVDWLTDDILYYEINNQEDNYVEQVGL